MNAVIINSSDTFDFRIELICGILREQGYQTKIITSDYMHREKKYREGMAPDCQMIHTLAYHRNISLKRLLSHYKFSRDAYAAVKNLDIDLLYLVIPPNSQAAIAKKYKEIHDTKVIMDIIDLWPESLPVKGTALFPFSLWSGIRNRNLKYADFVVTECDLYRKRLERYLEQGKTKTIYWSQKESQIKSRPYVDRKNLHLCYLGSINHIIDILEIGRIIGRLSVRQPVVLKIIGDGERREELIRTAEAAGARAIFYGKIYNPQEKRRIFDNCHFGINIMKKQVCVGLSMKSIDYFEAGLPVLNNLPGDTAELIDRYRAGINLIGKDIPDNIMDLYRPEMRENSAAVFRKYFSYDTFSQRFQEVLEYVFKVQ